MIGQKNLLNRLNIVLSNYPKFSIITGCKGSGKKTIVKYICDCLSIPMITFGTSIEEVREIIELSYEQDKPICYVCPDADTMSLGAKNALLKVTEEPPNNAYFILTLKALSNTLETIVSRATVFALDDYTKDELLEYRNLKKYSNRYDDILKEVCNSTGDVDELYSQDVDKFYNYAKTVAFSIQIPTSGNIFKIPKMMKTTSNGDGFDPILFFKVVRNLYLKKGIEEKSSKYLLASKITTECLQDLNLQTVNKIGTMDKWIMDVRKVLR